MVHRTHPHIRHGAQRPIVHRRNRRNHAYPRRERAADETAAILHLGKNGESSVRIGRHDRVVGLGRANTEFIDRHGLDFVAIGLDNGHRQAGNAHIENTHRRSINEPQPHALVGPE